MGALGLTAGVSVATVPYIQNEVRKAFCDWKDGRGFGRHFTGDLENRTLSPDGIILNEKPGDLTPFSLLQLQRLQQSRPLHGINDEARWHEYVTGGYDGFDFDTQQNKGSDYVSISHDRDKEETKPSLDNWLDRIEGLISIGRPPAYIKIDPKGYSLWSVVENLEERYQNPNKAKLWDQTFVILNLGMPLPEIPKHGLLDPVSDYQIHTNLTDLLSIQSRLPKIHVSIGVPARLSALQDVHMQVLLDAFKQLKPGSTLALPAGTKITLQQVLEFLKIGVIIIVWGNDCQSMRDLGMDPDLVVLTFFESKPPGRPGDEKDLEKITVALAMAR